MLFVSELKKKVAEAIPKIETIITGPNEYVIATIGTDVTKVISPLGQIALQKVFYDMRNREDEDHDNKLDTWSIAPNMPRSVIASTWQLESLDGLEIILGIGWLKSNRLNMITWMAYLYQLSEETNDLSSQFQYRAVNYKNLDMSTLRYSFISDRPELELVNNMENSQVMQSLKMMRDVKISKQSYIRAVTYYNATLADLERIDANKKPNGISKLFSSRPERLETSERHQVREDVKAIFDKIKNGLSSRTWGFEIEVPDAKGVEAPKGIEKGDDGSLRSENHEDCECDCSDCVYHECNCDHCDNHNDDPQHCSDDYCSGSADSAEFRSIGGIQRVLHVGMIELCDKLVEEDAEINSSAGTHIHVYGQDLSTNQVGQVLATYHWLYNNIFWPIAGRDNNQYAKPLNTNDIANALRRNNPTLRAEKPLVVNVTNLLNGRGTIEFRHQNCNLDSKLISVWAWLVRGLVEVAKRGATFAHFKECKTIHDMLAVYAKFNFTPESENPGLVIVGSKSDEERITKVEHKQFSRV